MQSKFFSILAVIAFVGVAFLMGVFYYWAIFPDNIISYPRGTTFPVVNAPIKAGNYLKYKIYYCKYTKDLSTIFTTLVGKDIYTLPLTRRNIPIGCRSYIISDVFIPPYTTPGIYHVEIAVQYQPNPIRAVQYFVKTDNFQIIK